ncbi:: HTH_17 [Gemmata massiliana]|uniref:: HTH_17 n=1 Tax=Gemmata massiliana TaxID=1210884 RepID=A0A6P2CUC6_9BACT|nr:helix-turn-helix domain-containing protein [Gemmata massiliana]VTR92157.1 : HTH_17 [Gemmata massiliana]
MVTVKDQIDLPVMRRMVTRSELAQMIGVSLDTIDRRRADLPPAVRIGRQLFWNREVVDEFLRGERRVAT